MFFAAAATEYTAFYHEDVKYILCACTIYVLYYIVGVVGLLPASAPLKMYHSSHHLQACWVLWHWAVCQMGRRLWAFEGVNAIFEQGMGDAS